MPEQASKVVWQNYIMLRTDTPKIVSLNLNIGSHAEKCDEMKTSGLLKIGQKIANNQMPGLPASFIGKYCLTYK